MGLRGRASGRVAVGLLALVSLASLPAGLVGQAGVHRTRLSVDLTAGDGSAAVAVEYELTAEAGAKEVTVELLGFGDATADHAFTPDGGRVVLWPASGDRRVASIALAASGPSARHVLLFEYRIEHAVTEEAGAVRARVPVLVASLPPAADGGDVFEASISAPRGWSVSDAFPTGLRELAPGVFGVSLQVVPSVVSLRGRTDGSWRPGFNLLVELLTATILLAFALVGWRHLRGLAA